MPEATSPRAQAASPVENEAGVAASPGTPLLAPAPARETRSAAEIAAKNTPAIDAPTFDVGPVIGWTLSVLVVIFFLYALRRARARRRAEISGSADLALPPEAEKSADPAPDEIPEAALSPTPDPPRLVGRAGEKEARRQAFLAAQESARKEAEARRAAKHVAQEADRSAREAEARTLSAKAKAQREALLAPSGSLTESLARTRGGLLSRLGRVLGKTIDDAALESLEELLFAADIGVHTATALVDEVRAAAAREGGDAASLKNAVRRKTAELLSHPKNGSFEFPASSPSPFVIMVVGVNGVGKTTTIGKLAGRMITEGKKVLLAAGDTFRAAAVEQLEVWGDRVGADVVRGAEGADPASVIFDAIERGKAMGADVIIADTAGRLHTKAPLMDELQKIHRVMGKARDGAPDEVLLVVDATTGQNALQQARLFKEAVALTGIALTKLDGTAKGGVVIGIAAETGLPIRYIGTGEQVGDLRPFHSDAFVAALFDEGESLPPDGGVER